MGHCSGVGTMHRAPAGVSPAANANSVPLPAAGQWFSAVTNWVENGTAPASIVLQSADASASQLLCPYPSKPVYGGTGAVTAAASYTCK